MFFNRHQPRRCGGGGSSASSKLLTVLAAAVPVGAIITLTDDGDGSTISTTQNNSGGRQMPIDNRPTVNYLENLPTSSSLDNNIHRTSDGSTSNSIEVANNQVTIAVQGGATTTYSFASPSSREGRLVSTDNNLIIYKDALENVGIDTFVWGMNPSTQGSATSDVEIVGLRTYIDSITPTLPANRPGMGAAMGAAEAMVSYAGRYVVARVIGTGDTENGFQLDRGRFTLDVDFAHTGANDVGIDVMSGETFDDNGDKSGDFMANDGGNTGWVRPSSAGIEFSNIRFEGLANTPLAGIVIDNLTGNFYGSNGPTALGGSARITTGNAPHTVMAIIAEEEN